MSLIAELKRRNVIRMAGLCLVGAWLIVQVSSTVLPMFGTPAAFVHNPDGDSSASFRISTVMYVPPSSVVKHRR